MPVPASSVSGMLVSSMFEVIVPTIHSAHSLGRVGSIRGRMLHAVLLGIGIGTKMIVVDRDLICHFCHIALWRFGCHRRRASERKKQRQSKD